MVPTKRIGFGAVHDHKREPRSLMLCPGSMEHVSYATARAWQLALELAAAEAGVDTAGEAEPLF
ncbi:hypothetical protein [Streptomyces sp. NPDC059411]|uniref:hypothetical protein n=1 Tax=Streptomyces sp. NPDC059411 TaxID=3346825 RepID=UPI003684847C